MPVIRKVVRKAWWGHLFKRSRLMDLIRWYVSCSCFISFKSVTYLTNCRKARTHQPMATMIWVWKGWGYVLQKWRVWAVPVLRGVVTLFPPCTTTLYSQRKFRSHINSTIVIYNKERNKIGEKKNKMRPPEMSNSQQNLDFRRMLPAYRYKAVKSPFSVH